MIRPAINHRKYDGATAQFLSVDPLWPMFISSGSYVYCTGDAVNKIDPWGLGERIDNPLSPHPGTSPQPGTGTSPVNPGTDSPMIVGHEDEYYRGVGVWLYDIAIGRYLRGLGATGDGIGPYGSGPGQSWVAPPRGIGPGGKGGVGYWSGRGATPETAVQLKEVVVKPWHAPMALATAAQIAFNEIAVPVMLAEPTPFGEMIVAAVNMALFAYQLQLRYNESFTEVFYDKGDPIGLERFTEKGKGGKLIDPKTKQWIEPDHRRNQGNGTHGGSWWKLYAKDGTRIGTITKDGRWLRP